MSADEKTAPPDSRAEWIGWALDALRRYAPDPVTDEPYEDPRDAEQFFWDEQCPSDGQFR